LIPDPGREQREPTDQMRLLRNVVDKIWEKVLILCGVLSVLLPTSPLNMPLTYRDSGVFLYVGWRILNGELPYRDIWDHKPPVVFYINALGLEIFNTSRWGVWIIEFLFLLTAAITGYYLIKKSLGTISAVLSSLLWLLTLVFVIQGGNLTEEYALPMQFAALWLAIDIDKPDLQDWRYFLIGVIWGAAFFTKQTSIGVWMAIIIYLILRRLISGKISRLIREILLVIGGSFAFGIPIAIFFGAQGTLPQFWNAAFQFNLVYAKTATGLSTRLAPLISGIKPLTSTGFLQISMIGYAFAVIMILYKKSTFGKWYPLLLIGLIDLPIELILVSISGAIYPHYYIAMLPVLSLFAGVIFWVCNSQISALGIKDSAKFLFVIGIMGIFFWTSFKDYKDQVFTYRRIGNETVINYIKSNTAPDDYVLMWGAESSINFFALRRSPTRFVYQYPLYKKGYVDEQMIEEFLGDIISKRPRLIIDTKNTMTPFYDFPIHSQSINISIAYLQSHYRTLQDIDSWTVYEYISGNP
jgi:hypothetical protein